MINTNSFTNNAYTQLHNGQSTNNMVCEMSDIEQKNQISSIIAEIERNNQHLVQLLKQVCHQAPTPGQKNQTLTSSNGTEMGLNQTCNTYQTLMNLRESVPSVSNSRMLMAPTPYNSAQTPFQKQAEDVKSVEMSQGCYQPLNLESTNEDGTKDSEPASKPLSVSSSSVSFNRTSVKNHSNFLTNMKKYYQTLYAKLSKTCGKESTSKRKNLILMAQLLQKKHGLSEVSLQELVVHLGCIIYPTKKLRDLKSAKTVDSEGKVKSTVVATQKLVESFHECLNDFTPDKLANLLQSKIFRELYQVYCQYLAKNNGKKGDLDSERNAPFTESVSCLTINLFSC